MERPTPFAAVVFHGCEQTRGLPSGTAEPHAKEPFSGRPMSKRYVKSEIRPASGTMRRC